MNTDRDGFKEEAEGGAFPRPVSPSSDFSSVFIRVHPWLKNAATVPI